MVHAFQCLWYQAFAQQPVQVVLIQSATKPQGYELALVSTNLDASAAQLIERYTERWPTEVTYEEGKELAGVGDARNRTRKAVERTVPFQFLCMLPACQRCASGPLSGRRPTDVEEHRQRSHSYLTADHPVVRRHARQAPPRDHRRAISPRTRIRPPTTEILQVQQR